MDDIEEVTVENCYRKHGVMYIQEANIDSIELMIAQNKQSCVLSLTDLAVSMCTCILTMYNDLELQRLSKLLTETVLEFRAGETARTYTRAGHTPNGKKLARKHSNRNFPMNKALFGSKLV